MLQGRGLAKFWDMKRCLDFRLNGLSFGCCRLFCLVYCLPGVNVGADVDVFIFSNNFHHFILSSATSSWNDTVSNHDLSERPCRDLLVGWGYSRCMSCTDCVISLVSLML